MMVMMRTRRNNDGMGNNCATDQGILRLPFSVGFSSLIFETYRSIEYYTSSTTRTRQHDDDSDDERRFGVERI